MGGRAPQKGGLLMIPNRKSASSKSHKKHFSHTAAKVHKKNLPSGRPMRGGIRL